MATHDYVIDNSTGANVRADINSVLQAILTNNSSSSAPVATAISEQDLLNLIHLQMEHLLVEDLDLDVRWIQMILHSLSK